MRVVAEVVGSGPAVEAVVAAVEDTTVGDEPDGDEPDGDGGPTGSDAPPGSDGAVDSSASADAADTAEADDGTDPSESDADGDLQPPDDGDPPESDDADDSRIAVERSETPDLTAVALGVVVGRVGDDVFSAASRAGREHGTPWLAVELGGIGGYPIAKASVAGFHPDGACYECLRGRVESNLDPRTSPVGVPDGATQRLAGAMAGSAAVDLLRQAAGGGPVGGEDPHNGGGPLGSVTELPHAERGFLPLPGCECGPEPDMVVRHGDEALDVEVALRQAERGLDDRLGIVQQVGEVDSFPAPYYLAQLADTSGFSAVSAPRQAAGVAADWNRAFLKALGESLERYAAGVYREADTVTASADDLDAPVTPTSFVTTGVGEWSPAEPIEWVPAVNLSTGGRVHVPADLVFHPPPEGRFRPPVSTGLGLHTAPTQAMVVGLAEVVERDAAMLAWYSTFEPLGLSVEDEAFESLARRARSEGLSVSTLLLTQDVDVPVVAVAVHRDEWPRFAVGSAAALDPVAAARSALEEAVQNWMELRNMGPDGAADAGGAIGEYADLPERARAFLDVERTVPADSVGTTVPGSPGATLDALVDRVTDVGLSAYATRTTTRDVASLGFESVRVVVPAAQPLFLGPPYFGERAERVPDDLGFEPRLDREHHPFP